MKPYLNVVMVRRIKIIKVQNEAKRVLETSWGKQEKWNKWSNFACCSQNSSLTGAIIGDFCNSISQEVEARESSVWGQPGLCIETLSKKKKED